MSLINKKNGNPLTSRKNRPSRNFQRMFEEFFTPTRSSLTSASDMWAPRSNFYEKDGSYVIEAEVPGVEEDDLEVRYKNGAVTVEGEINFEVENAPSDDEGNVQYYHREIQTRSFSRTYNVGQDVDSEAIEASLKGGVLEITIPKTDSQETGQQIPVMNETQKIEDG